MRPLQKTSPRQWLSSPGNANNREEIKNSLIDALGYYCAYCELPLGGYEIEHHKHSKGWKKSIAKEEWKDLLLICKDCREHISRETLTPAEKKEMLWPDEHATFSLDGKSPFVYQSREMRYLVYDEEGNTHADELKNLIFVTPNPAAGPELYNKARNTIDHFQLNMQKGYFNEGSNVMMVPYTHHMQQLDNRTFERTRAWTEATSAFERLKQITDQPDSDQHVEFVEMIKDQISTTAYFKGNWSVWMTVFNQLAPDNHALLERLFLRDKRYFKGIDTTKLKLDS